MATMKLGTQDFYVMMELGLNLCRLKIMLICVMVPKINQKQIFDLSGNNRYTSLINHFRPFYNSFSIRDKFCS